MLRESKTLSNYAPQAISLDRIAGGFHRHGKSHASMREPVGFHTKCEESVVDAPATRVDGIELQLAAQAQVCAKT